MSNLKDQRELDARLNVPVIPSHRIMTLEQRRASFAISHCMAVIGKLKEKQKPKTAVWNRLDQTEDCLGKALDFYRIQKFSNPDLRKASKLFDVIERELKTMLPAVKSKKQARRKKRNSYYHGKGA